MKPDFVEPGQVLTVTAEIVKQDEQLTWLKANGTVQGSVAVSARLILERFNVADRRGLGGDNDDYTRRKLREEFDVLYQPTESHETVG